MRLRTFVATCLACGAIGTTPATAQGEPKLGVSLSRAFDAAPEVSEAAFGALTLQADPKDISKPNLDAAAVLYAAWALEEMRLLEVADRVADKFASGKLPLSGGSKSAFEKYLSERPERLAVAQRRAIYAHVFGGSSGGIGTTNQDFAALFARFSRAVSEYERARLLAEKTKQPARPDKVRDAARALATNLSNHGYGATMYAAATLARQMRALEAMLSQPDLLQAYGAKDMWGVVDQVVKSELGGSVNTVRWRSMATSGASVIRWLGTVSKPLATSDGAALVVDSLVREKVTQSAQDLDGLLAPSQKLLTPSGTAAVAQVHALCFDKKRHLVACKIKPKK